MDRGRMDLPLSNESTDCDQSVEVNKLTLELQIKVLLRSKGGSFLLRSYTYHQQNGYKIFIVRGIIGLIISTGCTDPDQ